jgi:hypothetical protein
LPTSAGSTPASIAASRRSIRCSTSPSFADQLAPTDPIVAATGLLVGEVSDDPAIELFGLLGALAALGGEGERRVLLVFGR